jgi:hypothetical protein
MVVERFTARHPGGIASSWCTAHIPASVKKKCRNGVSDLYGRGRQWRTCALQGQVPQVSYAQGQTEGYLEPAICGGATRWRAGVHGGLAGASTRHQ